MRGKIDNIFNFFPSQDSRNTEAFVASGASQPTSLTCVPSGVLLETFEGCRAPWR